MSATSIQRHNGIQDYQFGEHRNARVHTYDTLAHANADASNANGRLCFVTETNRFYTGRSNLWISLESIGSVDVPDNLPIDENVGAIYAVQSDPAFDDEPNIYILNDDGWKSIKLKNYPRVIGTVVADVTLERSSYQLQKLLPTTTSFTVTIPAIAAPGEIIVLKDISGDLSTYPVYVVVASSGPIDGLSDPLEMNRNYQCLMLQYIGDEWLVLSDA